MDVPLSDPKAIAERGEKIYNERYRAQFEQECLGKFVAIDVVTGKAYVATSTEEAYEAARKESPKGLFHLIKVGSPGAFRVSTLADANLDWVFR